MAMPFHRTTSGPSSGLTSQLDSAFPPSKPEPLEADPLIDALVHELPEFTPIYRTLVEGCDDDPGEAVVLIELADFVASHAATADAERSLVERALRVVETHIESMGDDEVGCELVGLAFFDSLLPEDRRCLAPWLGSRSRQLLDGLDIAAVE